MTKARNITVAQYLTQAIDNSQSSQAEIAHALGYPNPNIITMFKQGRTKVPYAKVPALARALELDELHLLRLVMNEYAPETWKVIEQVVGAGKLVSRSEMKVVNLMREVAGDVDACPRDGQQSEDFKTQVKLWMQNSSAT